MSRQWLGDTLNVVLLWGASNAGGTNIDPNGCNSPPPLIPASVCDLFRRSFTGNEIATDTALVSLRVSAYGGAAGTSHGSELGMGLALYPLVDHLVILKVWANDTMYLDWVEGGVQNANLQTAIADFRTVLHSAYPHATSQRWTRVSIIGGKEGKTSAAACTAMVGFATTLRNQMVGYIGQPFAKDLVLLESLSIAAQPFLTEERAAETTIAATLPNGVLVNVDDIITVPNEQSDGRHFTGVGQNLVGTRNAGLLL